MSRDNIPRSHCFSLSDFHDFEKCVFRFLVKHNLSKKYELEEGSANKTVGSLLDLAIKKLHQVKAYGQPVEYLQTLIKVAEIEMRENVIRNGPQSFYGTQIQFLTSEVIEKAKQIFKDYYLGINGKFKRSISPKTFWEYTLALEVPIKIWGGPDNIEVGEDGEVQIVDYKYFEDPQTGKENLDMDLMPKLYTFLCADELLKLGYKKARFVVRLWQEPGEDSLSEEFDLKEVKNLEPEFKSKIDKVLALSQITFCEKDYCKVCTSEKRAEWLKELKVVGLSDGSSQVLKERESQANLF